MSLTLRKKRRLERFGVKGSTPAASGTKNVLIALMTPNRCGVVCCEYGAV